MQAKYLTETEIWLGAGLFPAASLVPVADRDCEKLNRLSQNF